MKRLFFIAILSLLAVETASAQDVILKLDAEEIEAKIEEITTTDIRYRLWSNPDGPLRIIPKAKVFRIKYANGDTEVFEAEPEKEKACGLVSKYSYQIGDIYNENGLRGVVVYVTDNGSHGLMVSPSRTKEQYSWDFGVVGGAARRWCKAKFKNTAIGCTDEYDGEKNMEAIEHFIEANGLDWSDFPNFDACHQLGKGWYIPAIRECEHILNAICQGNFHGEVTSHQLFAFKDKLKLITDSPYIGMIPVISSTECESDGSFIKAFVWSDWGNGVSERFIKKNSYFTSCDILPIHKF